MIAASMLAQPVHADRRGWLIESKPHLFRVEPVDGDSPICHAVPRPIGSTYSEASTLRLIASPLRDLCAHCKRIAAATP